MANLSAVKAHVTQSLQESKAWLTTSLEVKNFSRAAIAESLQEIAFITATKTASTVAYGFARIGLPRASLWVKSHPYIVAGTLFTTITALVGRLAYRYFRSPAAPPLPKEPSRPASSESTGDPIKARTKRLDKGITQETVSPDPSSSVEELCNNQLLPIDQNHLSAAGTEGLEDLISTKNAARGLSPVPSSPSENVPAPRAFMSELATNPRFNQARTENLDDLLRGADPTETVNPLPVANPSLSGRSSPQPSSAAEVDELTSQLHVLNLQSPHASSANGRSTPPLMAPPRAISPAPQKPTNPQTTLTPEKKAAVKRSFITWVKEQLAKPPVSTTDTATTNVNNKKASETKKAQPAVAFVSSIDEDSDGEGFDLDKTPKKQKRINLNDSLITQVLDGNISDGEEAPDPTSQSGTPFSKPIPPMVGSGVAALSPTLADPVNPLNLSLQSNEFNNGTVND